MFVSCLLYESRYDASRSSSARLTGASTTLTELGLRASATIFAGPEALYYFGFDFGFPTVKYAFTSRLGVPQLLESTPLESSAWVRYSTAIGPLTLDGGFHFELGYLTNGRDALRELQPRINASYLLAGTWRAKASFGRFSQRLLTIDNEDDVMSIFDAWVSLAADKKSEQADHYVLGVSGSVSEQATLNLEMYFKEYNSLMLYNRDKLEATDPDYLEGEGRSYGAEVTFRSHSKYVDLYGAYSLSWVRINNAGLVYFPRYDRRHHLNLLAVGHPLKGLTTTVKWEYGSGFPYSQTIAYIDRLSLDDALPGKFEKETGPPYIMLGPKNAARLPAYHRMDIGLTYNFNVIGFDVSVGGTVLNVYSNRNIFYFDRRTGQRVNMLSFYPSASLTVTY